METKARSNPSSKQEGNKDTTQDRIKIKTKQRITRKNMYIAKDRLQRCKDDAASEIINMGKKD